MFGVSLPARREARFAVCGAQPRSVPTRFQDDPAARSLAILATSTVLYGFRGVPGFPGFLTFRALACRTASTSANVQHCSRRRGRMRAGPGTFFALRHRHKVLRSIFNSFTTWSVVIFRTRESNRVNRPKAAMPERDRGTAVATHRARAETFDRPTPRGRNLDRRRRSF